MKVHNGTDSLKNAFGTRISTLNESLSGSAGEFIQAQLTDRFSGALRGGRRTSGETPETLVKSVVGDIENSTSRDDATKCVRQRLEGCGVSKYLRANLRERSNLVLRQVSLYVKGKTVLDYGCGDGAVGVGLATKGFSVHFRDVLDYRCDAARMPPHASRWQQISDDQVGAWHDGQIGTILGLTVLHHCRSPLTVIAQLAKLSPERIVTIESVCGVSSRDIRQISDDPGQRVDSDESQHWLQMTHNDQFAYACFWDWWYNQVINTNVQVPCNFAPPQEWASQFAGHGYSERHRIYLGIDQPLAPEFHVLQVFDHEE